jgi:hypothetical protein
MRRGVCSYCILVLSIPVVFGCGAPVTNEKTRDVSHCGESFCFYGPVSRWTKTTPVEDFNVYSLSIDNRSISIYEGNHPLSRADKIIIERVRSPFSGQPTVISRFNGGVEGRITTGRHPWPNYLVVTVRCDGRVPCDVRPFLERIRPLN